MVYQVNDELETIQDTPPITMVSPSKKSSTTVAITLPALFMLTVIIGICIGLLFCRTSYSITFPSMLDHKDILGQWFDDQGISIMLGCGTGLYFMGKLILGFVVDWYGGRFSMLMVSLVSLICCIAFVTVANLLGRFFPFFVSTSQGFFLYAILVIIYGLQRFIGSAMYISITKLVVKWFPAAWFGTVFGIISLSFSLGSVVASILLGLLMSEANLQWPAIYMISAVACFMAVLFTFLFVENSPKQSPFTLPCVNFVKKRQIVIQEIIKEEILTNQVTEQQIHPFEYLTTWQVVCKTACSPQFWVMCLAQMNLTIISEVSSFLPLFFKEAVGFTVNGQAGTIAVVFTIGCGFTLPIFGFIYDRIKYFTFGRTIFMCIAQVFACVACLLLALFPTIVWLSITCVFMLGIFGSPSNYIPPVIFASRFGGTKHCAKISALIDAFSYVAVMIFDFVAGSIISHIGWNAFFVTVLVCSSLGTIFITIYHIMEVRQVLLSKRKLKQGIIQ